MNLIRKKNRRRTKSKSLVQMGAVPELHTMFYHITDKCNLHCKHCWVEGKVNGTKVPLALEEAKEVVTQALPLGLKTIKFTGGEPFLVPWILDFIEFCSYNNIDSTFETNGTLITSDIIQRLSNLKVSCVSISIDGSNAEIHEKIRGVKGCFELSIRAIQELVKAGLSTIVVSIVYKGNIHDVGNTVALAEKLGVGTIKFNPVVPIGRGHVLEDNGELLCSEEYIRLFHLFKEIQKKTKICIEMDFPLLACDASNLGRHMYYNCNVGNMLGLMADGSFCLCGLAYTDKRTIYGNVRNVTIKEIWCDNPPEIIRSIRNNLSNRLKGVCCKCLFKYVCAGGCRAKAFASSGSILGPNPVCQRLFEEGFVPKSRLIYG